MNNGEASGQSTARNHLTATIFPEVTSKAATSAFHARVEVRHNMSTTIMFIRLGKPPPPSRPQAHTRTRLTRWSVAYAPSSGQTGRRQQKAASSGAPRM